MTRPYAIHVGKGLPIACDEELLFIGSDLYELADELEEAAGPEYAKQARDIAERIQDEGVKIAPSP